MRHLRPTCLLLGCLALPAAAADLSLDAILSPVSGCALGSAMVSVRLFNYGPTLPAGSLFNVSYAVNLGTPVTEGVVLGSPWLQNSAFSYSFTTPANLSLPGDYVFDANVNLPGDAGPSNNAVSGHAVRNDPATVGGTASGPSDAVMAGSVSLGGQIGSVREWQQSVDGLRWRRLANVTAVQTFAVLREHTWFRAQVQSGRCAPALSSAVLVRSSDPIFFAGFEP